MGFDLVSPMGFDCGLQYNIFNHNATNGWGEAWGDVTHASLCVQPALTRGSLTPI